MKNLLIFLGIVVFSLTGYAQNLKKHIVKAGESVEGIAKRYKISTADIYALNPDASSDIVINSILIIPESFRSHFGSLAACLDDPGLPMAKQWFAHSLLDTQTTGSEGTL